VVLQALVNVRPAELVKRNRCCVVAMGRCAVARLVLGKVPEKTLRKAVPECAGAVMSQGRLIRRSRQTPMPRTLNQVAQVKARASELIADVGDCCTHGKFHGQRVIRQGLANRDYG
jgi:coenzyme F420-reducing hydrogenase gamma subunit